MKCKRCGRQMERVRYADNRYRYECPNCHLRIGSSTLLEIAENEMDGHTPNASSGEGNANSD